MAAEHGEANMSDPVNRPAHYHFGKYDCLDVIEDLELGFALGNVLKYIWRSACPERGAVDCERDLQKAEYYLAHEIRRRTENAT